MNTSLNAISLTGRIGVGNYILEITPIDGGYRLTTKRGKDVQTIDIMNGIGIESIEKLGSTGNVDNYRITLSDGSTFDYSIETNEADRAAAELERINAEAARVSAEQTRVAAETDRVNAEAERAGTFAGYEAEIDQFKTEIVTSKDAATENTRFAIGKAEESLEVPSMVEFNELKGDLVTYQDYTFSNYGKENLLKYAVWVDGHYIQPSNGTTDVNASYSSTDYIELDNSKQYLCEVSGATWHYAFYDEDKVYIRGESTSVNYYWNLENTVKYCRVSMQTSEIDNNSLHIGGIQQKLNPNIKVEKSSVLSDTTIITVAKDGTMEFTSLRQALESITDSSETHKYIVEFYGDGSHYDIAAEYSSAERQSLNGLTIPDYTTLVGIGGREKCIIDCTVTSDESNRVFSALNMKTTSGIKGFTVIGRYTRNTLHHDFGYITNGISVIEDCTFIGSNLDLHYVCASGLLSGCKYIYKNCKFINETDVYTYSCHNGQNFINSGFVELENCRFKPTGDRGFSVRLGSITNQARNINCVCVLKGCKIPIQLLLNEESAEVYGRGILWKVIGYANDITSTYIENTDGLDYSENIDLIN